MRAIKVLDIPNSFSHNLPDNILKHCHIYKEPKVSLFTWQCLSEYIDLKKIRFTKNGKPYLLDKSKYISLSHSLNKVAIAISDAPIGIDIEKIVSGKVVSTLAKRVLNENQLKTFSKVNDKSLWFTKYWTKYEAMVKMLDMKQPSSDLKIRTISRVIEDNKKQKYVMTYVYINKKRG